MLTLTALVKQFGTNRAVDGLSLTVGKGEVFGLLGPNGAGKSTTVHMAVGLVEPTSGQVDVGGLGSPRQPAVRARIGVAPQALSLYELLTAEENLTFFGRVYEMKAARLAERVTWALEFVGLADRRRDLVDTYSGGMKRRLNLAAAILHDPDLVLLDEPTVGVDPQSRNAIFDSLLELKAAGKTIVYTTHYMEEAERLCDRVAIIDHGKLLGARHRARPDRDARRAADADPAHRRPARSASRRAIRWPSSIARPRPAARRCPPSSRWRRRRWSRSSCT